MELFTKDKDGNLEKVNGIHDDVATEVAKYWTPMKAGKHPDLGKKHEAILAKDLKVSGKDFFEQVNQNHFIFQNFGPISLKDFLRKARLDKYVKDEYLDDCLHVTSPQPAIGRGEFLLVANFGNINFADGSGDLVDNDGNRIEVKGKHANLGGKNEWFKQMNRSVLFSLFNLFETGTQEKDLNLEDKIAAAKQFNSKYAPWTEDDVQEIRDAIYARFDPDFGGLNKWSVQTGNNGKNYIYFKDDEVCRVAYNKKEKSVNLNFGDGTGIDFEFDPEEETFEEFIKFILTRIKEKNYG